MKRICCSSPVFILIFLQFSLTAQQQVTVISRCGGTETITIPSITDNDLDGMDDVLEQKLLNYFTPVFIQYNDESCPGPATDGTGDSNLIVCHIYPIPQQYTFSSNLDSVKQHPVALVPQKGLAVGMIWCKPLIKINAALLYGKDCGLLGHTADVEGFNYSLKYIGSDSIAGWMYDTVMQHWTGATIQTISHAGTPCEQIETLPYTGNPADTVLASPDKHGNYLTTSACGASFICNPGCGATPSRKNVRPVSVGEANAPLVTDLGNYYTGYAGENPWSMNTFLGSQGGNAGAIGDKMILSLTSDFIQGEPISNHAQICSLYTKCFGQQGHTINKSICNGESFSFNGTQLANAGIYYDTLATTTGCDSLITLHLVVLNPSANSFAVSTCNNSYNFNGQTLSNSGTYQDTLSNANGCDSVVTLYLTLNQSSAYSYNVSVCPGNSYNFNGQIITASGNYVDTISNSTNCDSVITLHFTIDSLPALSWGNTPDTLPAASHAVLLDAQPAGGSYAGNGVHGNIFYPDSVSLGCHIVAYTYTNTTGCSETITHTICIIPTNTEEVLLSKPITLYPNPANETLVATCSAFQNNIVNVEAYNSAGVKVAMGYKQEGQQIYFDTENLPEGYYYLKFELQGNYAAKCFVKKK